MNIRTLSPEELSHRFHECVKRRAELEGSYFLLDENRKILFERITIEYAQDGMTHGKAQSMARLSKGFKTHIEGQAAAKTGLYQARGDLAECDFEIRRRINKAFTDNQQRKIDGQMV